MYLSESIFKIKRGFGRTTTTTTTKNLDLLLGPWKPIYDKSLLIKLNYITRLFYCDKPSNAGFGHWTGSLKFWINLLPIVFSLEVLSICRFLLESYIEANY